MNDPIERVAHFLEKIIGDEAGRCAAIAVPVYREWLRQQGIPVDKLLSGEMVAGYAPDHELAQQTIPQMVAEIEQIQARISDKKREQREAFERATREARKLAQADYAGGQVVTPEGG